MTTVARQRQDPRRVRREASFDEIVDERACVPRHRQGRQRRWSTGLVDLGRTMVEELRKSAGSAHAEAEGQPGRRAPRLGA